MDDKIFHKLDEVLAKIQEVLEILKPTSTGIQGSVETPVISTEAAQTDPTATPSEPSAEPVVPVDPQPTQTEDVTPEAPIVEQVS